jgi:hypothetical protein
MLCRLIDEFLIRRSQVRSLPGVPKKSNDYCLTSETFNSIKKILFAGTLPVDLLNQIHQFKGSNTFHLERAFWLYVKVMSAKG